jgi:3-methylcrotonyl-CoA carboxylase alpha subunit
LRTQNKNTQTKHSWPVASWSKDAAAGAVTGAVRTPMPGKLVKLLVADGDAVVAGQPLLVLESMKMETTLPSPRAGVVTGAGALHAGAQIEEGQVLLRVVEPGEGGEGEGGVSENKS